MAAAAAAPSVARTTANGVAVTSEVHHDTSAPLRSMRAGATTTQVSPVRHGAAVLHSTAPQNAPQSAPDTSGQGTPLSRLVPATNADFAGITNLDGVLPPDTQGAAGPTQYVAMVNSHIAVYSKTGATLLAPETTNTLWSGFGGGCQTNNNGDGTVLYDALSGHWVLQQFSVTAPLPYLECVAVSTTTDATGTWNRYAFQTPAQNAAGDGFPDYPKMGVWPDGYYATFNLFNGPGTAGQGTQVCAYDRSKMILGQAASQQCVQVSAAHPAPRDDDTVLPSSVEGSTAPPAGAPNYLLSSPQVFGSQSTLNTWSYHVDWTTPANSSLSAATSLTVSPYTQPCFTGASTDRDCVPQGGSSQRVDAVADRLMSRLSYRNLGTRESLVVDQSVVSGSSIGMRWYELAPSGGALSLVQQGTVAPDATYRWMGSVSEDASGDIAMGYSAASSSVTPQIRYSARLVGDPVGTMPQGEGTVALGASGAQTIGNRWGDYSSMTVDPTDNCTFWYAQQHGTSTGDWTTRIASFKLPSCGTTATNDFSMSANPNSVTVNQGGSGTSTITTALVSGSAQTVTLSASGLPSGASASFNPSTVTVGGSSTMTITAGATTPAGQSAITVTGTGTSATHSTGLTLTVNSTNSGDAVVNGGFETGSFSSWTTTGTTAVVTTPHTGTYSARLGGTSPTNGDSTMQQTITVPANATLSFWYQAHCPDTLTYDWATMEVRNTSNATLLTPLARLCSNAGTWTHVTQSLSGYANQTVVLWFNNHDDNYPSDPTYTFFDDVSVTGTASTPDFSISANPNSLSLVQGTSGTSTISTAVITAPAQTVNLAVSGAPNGVTATVSPTSVTAGGNSTLTITTTASAAVGSSTITVTGTGTSATHATTVALTVTAPVVSDFTISATPSSLSVAQGASGTSTITTALVSGTAQTVSLSASGLPSGASATFNPPSVTVGGSSSMTITTAAATPTGQSTITVTGTGTSRTHTTAVTLTVTAPSTTVVTNGGFETGSLAGWTTGGVYSPFVTTAQKHSGSYSAQLGASATPEPNGDSSLVQTVAVPSGSSALSFWYWPATTDTITYDWQEAQIRNTSGTQVASVFKVASNASTWTQVTFDMTPYAGTTVQLYFNVHGDGFGDLTYMYLDDVAVTPSTPPPPPPGLTQISSDPYTNTTSEHATQVEPDTFANGSTIVSVFQTGRFNDGGSNDTGWATSTNGGATWSHGFLPGITTWQGGGTWARVSDPSVAYDARHGVWVASGLVIDSAAQGRGVSVNRSTDGVTWANATMAVSTTTSFLDKDWIVCDSTATSPNYGNCYIEYDNNSAANTLQMLTSTDGGLTWSAPRATADTAHGLGGQPLVQPNGTVVVPYLADGTNQIRSFTSTNGGASWNSSVLVSAVTIHSNTGGLRTSALPSAEIDGTGTVYVAWQDCKFRSGCPANDIVMSSSTNGATWGAVQRIPIDATTSTVDHFIPGLAVDRSTSGATTHLGLYYYFYPTASCSSTTCQLDVGFVSSTNAGTSWSSPTQVAGPMTMAQIAATTQGPMVGDYISASFMNAKAYPVFAVGVPASGAAYNEAMYTVSGGLAIRGGGHRPDIWRGSPLGGGTRLPASPVTRAMTAF